MKLYIRPPVPLVEDDVVLAHEDPFAPSSLSASHLPRPQNSTSLAQLVTARRLNLLAGAVPSATARTIFGPSLRWPGSKRNTISEVATSDLGRWLMVPSLRPIYSSALMS
jgi:hypothetical protein